MKSLTRTHQFTVKAPLEKVFPLLCPVREYEWIPGWDCELLHSQSGVAEEDCVFRTDRTDTGPMTWVVSRYQPPDRIEFTCFADSGVVMRLKIKLQGKTPSRDCIGNVAGLRPPRPATLGLRTTRTRPSPL